MDKLDYALLDFLLNTYEATTKMRSATRKVITSAVGVNEVKASTIYRRITRLISEGYVNKGIVEVREHTYFITDNGIKALEEALK